MRIQIYVRPGIWTEDINKTPIAPIQQTPILIHDTYDPDKSHRLISPSLHLEESAAGSLQFIITKEHPYYNNPINIMSDTFYVVRDGKVIWDGRPTREDKDWYGSKTVYCEGALAYLNDSLVGVSPDPIYDTCYEFLYDYLLPKHNRNYSRSLEWHETRGASPRYLNRYLFHDRIFFETASVIFENNYTFNFNPNFESCLTWVKDYIASNMNARFKIVYPTNSINYLMAGKPMPRYLCMHNSFTHRDVAARLPVKKVDFSKNLLSFSYSREFNASYGNSILPRGKSIDAVDSRELPTFVYMTADYGQENPYPGGMGPDRYRLEETLISGDGVYNNQNVNRWRGLLNTLESDIKQYGPISKVIDFQDEESRVNLRNRSIKQFNQNHKEIIKETVTINALELGSDDVTPPGAPTITSPSVYTALNGSSVSPSDITLPNRNKIWSLDGHQASDIWPDRINYNYCDLNYYDIWTKVVCTSKPHLGSTAREFYVTAIDIPIDNPYNTTVTMQNNFKKFTDSYITSGAQFGDVAGTMSTHKIDTSKDDTN